MKKIRIMLIGMVVLAAVGGALAFSAKKFNTAYCTTTGADVVLHETDASNCDQILVTSTSVDENGSLIYFTPTVLGVCQFPAGAKCTAYYTHAE